MIAPEKPAGFGTYLYMSGVTFFTLGYGDVYPLAGVGRALAVAETGMGFSFLAGLVGYLPLFSQAFCAAKRRSPCWTREPARRRARRRCCCGSRSRATSPRSIRF